MNSTSSKFFGFCWCFVFGFAFFFPVAFLALFIEQLPGGAEFEYFQNLQVSPCGFEARVNSTRQKK